MEIASELKRDPYNSLEKWKDWIDNKPKIEDTSKANSDLIIKFLEDFELGKNTGKGTKKGERSPIRLMALKSRLTFFAQHYKNKKLTSINKDDIHKLFADMRNGAIKKENGGNYISVSSYVKDWKTFWHWLIKVKKVKVDINEDLSSAPDHKPAWVYLTEEQFKTLADQTNEDYRALVWFLLDTGARVTEAYSVRVSDFSEDFSKLTIRAETSKNHYERTIQLKLSSALIKNYVAFYQLKDNDFLFQKKPHALNKYLKEKCTKLFGTGISHPKAKGKFSSFTAYDIRHLASCYWLKRYPSYSKLMYRMGWTSESFVRYYSEFLGQNDTIRDEDMITEQDKGKLEKLEVEVKQLRANNKAVKEQINFIIEQKMKEINETLAKQGLNIKIAEIKR